MQNISFDDFIITSSGSHYFNTLLKRRQDILSNFDRLVLEQDKLLKSVESNFYRVLTLDDLPLIFKYKNASINPLYKYISKHLMSSIIKRILLDGPGETKQRINRAVYILYYYWFSRKDKIKDIIHNVCIDIENIIGILINNGLTTYKDYTVSGELVEELRNKLRIEKLMEAVN